MIVDYTGIVIRQTKATGSLRMVHVFTREAGIIDCGTRISERSKGGAALAIRPFAYGRYTVRESGNGTSGSDPFRTITQAETIDAHFSLGENERRFAEASFALEFTGKAIPPGINAESVFDLLVEYMDMLCVRKTDFRLLTIAYLIGILKEMGIFPDKDSLAGGMLPIDMNDDILDVVVYVSEKSLKDMRNLTLKAETERAVFRVLIELAREHLDLGVIKSEHLLD